jgi:hypothetical protein
LRRIVHRARTRWCESKGAEPQTYPAEKARGGEIILRRAWQRVLFVLGLAVPILALLALLMLR